MLSLSAIRAAILTATLCYGLPPPQDIFGRETMLEAAGNAQKLVHEISTGTLASVFPPDGDHAGRPLALMEYHAPCHPSPSLTFLLFPISLSTRNILSTPEQYASYTVQTPVHGRHSQMDKGRVALIGNMTILSDLDTSEEKRLQRCYEQYHPDVWWFPSKEGNGHPLDAMWARFDVQDIYYVGGFGDTHYIGHIPVEMYAEAGKRWDGGKGLVVQ